MLSAPGPKAEGPGALAGGGAVAGTADFASLIFPALGIAIRRAEPHLANGPPGLIAVMDLRPTLVDENRLRGSEGSNEGSQGAAETSEV